MKCRFCKGKPQAAEAAVQRGQGLTQAVQCMCKLQAHPADAALQRGRGIAQVLLQSCHRVLLRGSQVADLGLQGGSSGGQVGCRRADGAVERSHIAGLLAGQHCKGAVELPQACTESIDLSLLLSLHAVQL